MTRLGLGTAQFGLDYGISNPEGRTPEAEVTAILKAAVRAAIEVLDTAPGYGDSQKVLGEALSVLGNSPFRLVTKTPAFRKDRIREEDARTLLEAFRNSLALLKQDRVDGLLVHVADDLLTPGGERLFEAMRELRSKGRVRRIGVSVYTRDQLFRVLERHDLDMVQLPMNILNQQFVRDGTLRQLASRGIEIHARSIFLQGLLCMDPADLPAHFGPILGALRRLREYLLAKGLSPVEGALAFACGHPEISTLLIGVNHRAHLIENVELWRRAQRLDLDFSPFQVEQEAMVNPSLWPTA